MNIANTFSTGFIRKKYKKCIIKKNKRPIADEVKILNIASFLDYFPKIYCYFSSFNFEAKRVCVIKVTPTVFKSK